MASRALGTIVTIMGGGVKSASAAARARGITLRLSAGGAPNHNAFSMLMPAQMRPRRPGSVVIGGHLAVPLAQRGLTAPITPTLTFEYAF